ncbi:PaaI family thioesterase [Erythrobacter sp. BLCC-B19]|uniref:PaaI family thioesterase n=1 Tax=Erythrobacter sp. BLCC-B19 TaxID=3025315 RepID=UPI002360D0BE|nr:PaaI family thioesterase [Erythrobacter sp. BLCC-B19]WDA40484.1 PaaI family thioesterase [Erythrobacter sp. BLCC-B19]
MNPADAMPFSKLMGVQITAASADAVEGEITVRDDLCTAGGIMHGGAIMAFADALGAVGAVACLPDGAKGTTTIESKTNFLGAAPVGSLVRGVARPLKTGRRMSVWQTTITAADGKAVAVVIQTQLVL